LNPENNQKSFGHIIKASAIIGSGSAAFIISGIIKNKVMAMLLGPAGIGFFGLLQSVMSTSGTIAGMGLSNSGVREIAEVHATGNAKQLTATRNALRISAVALGLLGAIILVVFRRPIAKLAIGDYGYAGAIAWMGIGVWATTVSGSQTALLNGFRHLGDLARVNIIGAVSSMVTAVIAVWLWGLNGVIVAVVSMPFFALGASWWFSHKIKTTKIRLSWRAIIEPLKKIFGLGFILMSTGLMAVGTQLVVRIIVTRSLGINATGHFLAAWSISMIYLGFVLGAMGTDYYPRLTAVAKDSTATNKMVNEQTEVALLLSGPVILGMLTFAPQLINLLYSQNFTETNDILRWQILGDLFKVGTWTTGFIILAQGRGRIFFFTELFWNLIYILFILVGLKEIGLQVTGIAFFLAYVLLFLTNWIIAKQLTDFTWDYNNKVLFAILAIFSGIVFFSRFISEYSSIIIGATVTLITGSYSVVKISRSVGGISLGKLNSFFKLK